MMNTENYIPEKEANIIKLPSVISVLKNLRYLLGTLNMVLGVIVIITESKKIDPNTDTMFFSIVLFVSGWVLAFTSQNNIFQPYKELRNSKVSYPEVIPHIILTAFWLFGLFMGLYILFILILVVLNFK
ncbi:MAG: hypothetical protein FIB07_06945 [Candidatus Methanoperedens sp.]|nr:hypothetical protein [Candidatus Methanoperedens sp.]